MKKFSKTVLGLSTVSTLVFTYLYFNKDDIKSYREKYQVKKDQFNDFLKAKNRFDNSLSNLKKEIPHINKVVNDIQTDVKKFNFEIEPNIKKINRKIDQLNNRG